MQTCCSLLEELRSPLGGDSSCFPDQDKGLHPCRLSVLRLAVGEASQRPKWRQSTLAGSPRYRSTRIRATIVACFGAMGCCATRSQTW